MSLDIARIADVVRRADALLVTAGAGMGVDSGLPDFRGTKGFWKAYPPFHKLGLRFEELANPHWFHSDPALAWGFYGHRLNTYRATSPHVGFDILRRWSQSMKHGAFVFTSNVDGAFQKAGFGPDRVVEVHGSIHSLQCLGDCGVGLFPADGYSVDVDEQTMRAREPWPSCPNCGRLARPNILMFGDGGWDWNRSEEQQNRLRDWLKTFCNKRLVIIECGAGTAIPTVRDFGERLARSHGATLIRINVREPETPMGFGLAMGARAALEAINRLFSSVT